MVDQLDLIHQEIELRVKQYLQDPNPDYYLYLNPPPGTGKTTTVCKVLAQELAFFTYLTNKHDLADEQITQQPVLRDCIHIESRARLCENAKLKKLADHGVNLKYFCPDCSNHRFCEYYQRMIEIFREPQSWVGVHSHLGGLANMYAELNPIDVIVIDEYFINAIFTRFTIVYDTIIHTTNLLNKLTPSKERTFFTKLLFWLGVLIQNKQNNWQDLVDLVEAYFRKGGTLIRLQTFVEIWEKLMGNHYLATRHIFDNIITNLVNMIINCLNYGKLNIDYLQALITCIETDKAAYLDLRWYNQHALQFPCRVIILDATTPKELYEHLFHKRIETMTASVDTFPIIYQITRGAYFMSSLDQVQTMERMLKVTRLIMEKHQCPILVATRKKYKEKIQALDPRFLVDHYPLVGSNDYSSVNVFIAFGTPEPRPDDLARKAKLLQYDIEKLRYVEREANILQAIHRIRLVLKQDEPTYIYLLTNIDLGFKNQKKVSVRRLENLLGCEDEGACSDEQEDDLRQQIKQLLWDGPKKKIFILNNLAIGTAIGNYILEKMQQEQLITQIKTMKAKGRPTLMLSWVRDF